jgi:hypothetical protein
MILLSMVASCASSGTAPANPEDPGSSRLLKKDIAYLSTTQVDELEEQALKIRLATFRYRQGDDAKHLGFILEDSPGIPAADPAHAKVDLYAYASMAIASAQAQARRIEQLEEEVDALSTALEAPDRSHPGAPGPACHAPAASSVFASR